MVQVALEEVIERVAAQTSTMSQMTAGSGQSVIDLSQVPLVDSDQCCGAAGIYNLVEPAVSNAVLEPKLGYIAQTGAAYVATGNPGCLMQIGAGLRRAGSSTRTVHPVDLLDASYAARATSDAPAVAAASAR